MIDVEAVQFAVGGQIDAGLALGVKNDAGGVNHSLLTRQSGEPVRDRIRADSGGLNHSEVWNDSQILGIPGCDCPKAGVLRPSTRDSLSLAQRCFLACFFGPLPRTLILKGTPGAFHSSRITFSR